MIKQKSVTIFTFTRQSNLKILLSKRKIIEIIVQEMLAFDLMEHTRTIIKIKTPPLSNDNAGF